MAGGLSIYPMIRDRQKPGADLIVMSQNCMGKSARRGDGKSGRLPSLTKQVGPGLVVRDLPGTICLLSKGRPGKAGGLLAWPWYRFGFVF